MNNPDDPNARKLRAMELDRDEKGHALRGLAEDLRAIRAERQELEAREAELQGRRAELPAPDARRLAEVRALEGDTIQRHAEVQAEFRRRKTLADNLRTYLESNDR